jgi:hypothetical protein
MLSKEGYKALQEAAALAADPNGWTKFAQGLNAESTSIAPWLSDCKKRCAVGYFSTVGRVLVGFPRYEHKIRPEVIEALGAVCECMPEISAQAAFAATLRYDNIGRLVYFNNAATTTHADVYGLFVKALEKHKPESALPVSITSLLTTKDESALIKDKIGIKEYKAGLNDWRKKQRNISV